ncbi:CGH_3_HP_G0015340.mRNA.1.CDS.1 [Saccharomyces cerevisiae]|nr:CGH_3_HP_G0015340.mRNA.1.CDS.1 [Saccharomyces cerevisiae]CAI4940085.1 CGH_1_HP_G0030500.mRNA.1.CDS.1 [Saccharomyces cerevisiae]CAI5009209.1 CGH_1_HP_G0082760.mRNA.1.CDS.1 [Saccharomyces cerevisiae]CAI5074752.1 CGH_1_HP_G0118980.mRNA.1.CDS.1 [Saccharomyces cerevisiae]CAI6380640.1 CGH_3_HP_G0015340.mRNA.1.CDS.1 [Saccharomyces cerevisiae]
MASITFRTPLSSQEQAFYNQKFHQLDTEDLGVVTGEAVRPLFASSGLPGQLLSQVWATVDIDNKGFLNLNEFSAALRMIAQLQNAPNQPISAALYESTPTQLASFSINQNPAPMQSGSATGNTNNTDIPALSSNDIAKFSQLFDRAAKGAQTVAGDKAKDIFLKARLPNQTLGEIWALCDRDASGVLDKSEFIMAMYLIQLCMSHHPSMNTPPAVLPTQLWDSIRLEPVVVNQPNRTTPLSANSTGISSLTRHSTISRLSTGAFSNAASDWSLSFEKKQQFDAIFDSLDKQHAGSLSSAVLVPFFLSSRLNQETLATIWDLADIHNNAEFTKLEFAIAMFLIQKKNAGVELPDVIPNELLQSPALGLYPPNPLPQQQSAPQIAIPSRASKPSLQDMPHQVSAPAVNTQPTVPQVLPQNSNNGSLNDLLALNPSFSSPSPTKAQTVVQNNTNNSFSYDSNNGQATLQQQQPQQPPPLTHSSSGLKKFTPTSNFGQSIIKEEPEEQEQLRESSDTFSAQPPPVPKHASSPVKRTASTTLPQVPNFSAFSMPAGAATSAATGAAVGAAVGAAALGASAFSRSSNNAFKNQDLFADGEASAQLSNATTEMANLSNQVNSLSKQASITNDKKSRATQELKRVTEMKNSIQIKLNNLRSTHDQNVKQTEQLEAQVLQVNKENETLAQQLAVSEANYHAAESKLNELTTDLQESQTKNAELKEQITNLNSMTASLQSQLNEKQQQVKQERSMVDVNSKQLELNQVTVANLQKEIDGLGEKISVYLTKQKELNDYQKTVEEQHAQLQAKYQDLSNKDTDLTDREKQLEERNRQIEEQENLYHQHVSKLQEMFDDLSQRKASFEKADQELKERNIEYANNVRELSERQMNLAMGQLPEDAKDIIAKSASNTDTTTKEATSRGNVHEDTVSKFVETTVENSNLNVNRVKDDEEKTERTESDVFDRDVPTLGSQSDSENANTNNGTQSGNETANPNLTETLSDRFDGDLNEYGIPRSQSLTSSVANNAPQSVRDDVELPETLEERDTINNTANRDNTGNLSHIPGEWEATPATASTDVLSNETTEVIEDGSTTKRANSNEDGESVSSIQESPKISAQPKAKTINEEFPPIQELHIDESDSSSSDDDEFEDTREIPSATVKTLQTPYNAQPTSSLETHTEQVIKYPAPGTSPSHNEGNSKKASTNSILPVKDEFDDEFAGLEQAAVEEDNGADSESEFENVANAGSMEQFETIDHKDLDDELQMNAFTGTLTSPSNPNIPKPQVQQQSTSDPAQVSNDEWDEIFAGFGNSKAEPTKVATPSIPQQPIPLKNDPIVDASLSKGPIVNRGVATTPKSLAVEELSGMGFTEEEAHNALEKCNWDLEAATNFLLDSA